MVRRFGWIIGLGLALTAAFIFVSNSPWEEVAFRRFEDHYEWFNSDSDIAFSGLEHRAVFTSAAAGHHTIIYQPDPISYFWAKPIGEDVTITVKRLREKPAQTAASAGN